jgi:hypothetical protein
VSSAISRPGRCSWMTWNGSRAGAAKTSITTSLDRILQRSYFLVASSLADIYTNQGHGVACPFVSETSCTEMRAEVQARSCPRAGYSAVLEQRHLVQAPEVRLHFRRCLIGVSGARGIRRRTSPSGVCAVIRRRAMRLAVAWIWISYPFHQPHAIPTACQAPRHLNSCVPVCPNGYHQLFAGAQYRPTRHAARLSAR